MLKVSILYQMLDFLTTLMLQNGTFQHIRRQLLKFPPNMLIAAVKLQETLPEKASLGPTKYTIQTSNLRRYLDVYRVFWLLIYLDIFRVHLFLDFSRIISFRFVCTFHGSKHLITFKFWGHAMPCSPSSHKSAAFRMVHEIIEKEGDAKNTSWCTV